MPQCREMKSFDQPANLAGFGSDEQAARKDLQEQANRLAHLWRGEFGPPCSEGTGCGDTERCIDFGRILYPENILVIKNVEPIIKSGQEFVAVYGGPVRCECRCAKA